MLGLIACGTAARRPAAPARCPTTAVVIASQADVARLASCATLAGVTIRTGAALDLSQLRALTAITGDLAIGPTVAVQEVTLGALRTVTGSIRVVGNGLLQGVFLPGLERAAAITVDGNVALTTLSLPRLVTVTGALQVTDASSLELVDLPAVTRLGGLTLTGVPKLTLVEAGQLHQLGALELAAPLLPADTAARLRALASEATPP
jgi:hypothetical protein